MILWISELDIVLDEVHIRKYFLLHGRVVEITRCLHGEMDPAALQSLEQGFQVVGIKGAFPTRKGHPTI